MSTLGLFLELVGVADARGNRQIEVGTAMRRWSGKLVSFLLTCRISVLHTALLLTGLS